ncbi:MAG: molybdopterin oxidoreductase, partial [Candidatus Binatia bacterium]
MRDHSLELPTGPRGFDRHLETASLLDPIDRRRFLQLMGASMALSGLGACTRQPKEAIVPYVKQPEEIVPGKPLYYATAALHGGYATGVLVESHMGRPTKIEGNPEHPASRGATDLFAQASVLDLYDPDRSQVVTHLAQIQPWSGLVTILKATAESAKASGGAGFRILSGPSTSPTLEAQMRALRSALPEMRWHRWQPVHRDGARAGALQAFGKIVDTQLRLAEADVILALDSDFLACGPAGVRHARDFAARRRAQAELGAGQGRPVRLYAVESSPTTTGASADHRIPMRASEIEAFALAVAAKLGLAAGNGAAGAHAHLAEIVAEDLQGAKNRALVVAGDDAPAGVHALAHAINDALGAVGTTVVHTEPVEVDPVLEVESIRALADDMAAGKVATLVILGSNPVYDAPADLEFGKWMQKVGLRVHLGLHADETAELCHWHVPAAHPLESWSDARAFDGTVTILQPLIEPIYGGKSGHELLAVLTGQEATPYDLVREH